MSGNGSIAFARPYFSESEAQAAADVIRSGWVVGGPQLREFEREFAAICGAKHAVGVNSWTTGGFLVMHALGIGPGDEVVVPSYTFIASVNAITHTGATPVFADIDPQTWNVDPDDVASKMTPRTRLILPVDQLGLPCDVDAIEAIAAGHGIPVLEDAACAFGSRNRGRPVGSLCAVTVFSLHARKVVTTGEGGMIVTDDGELAERLRRLRHQGMSLSDYARHGTAPSAFESYPEVGFNYRMTDIQAAVGRVQIAKLDEILDRRRAIAKRYLARLEGHPSLVGPFVPEGLEPNWQTFQITVRPESGVDRNTLMDRLHECGIPTRRGVMASHLEEPYRHFGARLPVTEQAAAQTLQLPMHPTLSQEHQDEILDALDALTEEARKAG